MQRKLLIILSVLISFEMTWASIDKDREQILGMAGCYEVRFQFTETFSRKPGYQLQSPYSSGALEWITVDVDKKDRVELQHLLVVGPGAVIKHWRQEWIYEDVNRKAFKGDMTWVSEDYSAKRIQGQWEQNVTQVDDSPRYECQAQWIHSGNNSFWECTSWNPLPRREFSTRNDYNVLNRRNRHQQTSYGWVHEQDNEKLVVKNNSILEILTEEKGKNSYTRVDDKKCSLAKVWWEERKKTWETIREAWDKIHSEYGTLTFRKLSSPLWKELGQLSEKANSEGWPASQLKDKAYFLIKTNLK